MLLPGLAVAFACGIVLADQGEPSAAGCLLAARCLLVLAALLRRTRRASAVALALALGACGAASLAGQLEASRAFRPDGELRVTLEGRVAGVTRRATGNTIELARVRAIDPDPRLPERIELREFRVHADAGVDLRASDALSAGDRVRLRARLQPLGGRANPGSERPERQDERRGIGARGRLEHPSLLVRFGGGRPAPWEALRKRIHERLAGRGEGLLLALSLADRRFLTVASQDAWRRLGLSHLLAVSGLHVGAIAASAYGLALFVLRRLPPGWQRGDARSVSALFGALAGIGFAALAGFGAPVQRAAALLALAWLARRVRRPGGGVHWIAAAVLFVLVRDPAAVFSPGAQLSFAGAGALLLARAPEVREDPEATWAQRRRRGLGRALHGTLVAWAATAPIAAWHFGVGLPFALATNLVAVPLVAFVLLPAALISALAVSAVAEPPGLAALALLATTIDRVVMLAASLTPPVPPARPFGGASAVVAFGLAALVAAVPRLQLRIAAALVLAAVLALAPVPGVPPGPPRVVFLDVGQGDAVLLEAGTTRVLVDAGFALRGVSDRGARTVLPALRALGVRELDLVVATHSDVDHAGGLVAVLRSLPVGELWLPNDSRGESGFTAALAAARSNAVPVYERGAGSAGFRSQDLDVTPLWPPEGAPGSANHRSLVVRASLGSSHILLAGDLDAAGERALLAAGIDLRAHVLGLPHHGSATSSTEAWLDAVAPELAIVSAPCRGRFSMPHPTVRARLRERGIPLAWTGRDGAVLVSLARPRWLRTVRGGRALAGCFGERPGRG